MQLLLKNSDRERKVGWRVCALLWENVQDGQVKDLLFDDQLGRFVTRSWRRVGLSPGFES